MDNIKSQIETLREDSQGNVNYDSWRFKLDLTLKSKKIFGVATGVEVKPEGAEDNLRVSTWLTKDLEAQALIGLNCSGPITLKINKCTTAHAMLQKLESLYGKKSEATIEGLQSLFFGYKYNEKKSVIENCMQIQEYADNLTSQGELVKESWIMQRILGILPPKLRHFRTAWDNVTGADKSLAVMFERLRVEEDRQKEDGEQKVRSSSQTALVAKGGNHQGKSKNGQSDKCFKCGKSGHFKAKCTGKPCESYIKFCKDRYGCKLCKEKGHFQNECPNKRSDQKSGSDARDVKRALVSLCLSSSSLEMFGENFSDVWLQDCAATEHMSSRRELFTNFSLLKVPMVITIGDGTNLEATGIGDVELEAFDGTSWSEVVLKNVLYVPKMPFNLFSVGSVLNKGYTQFANLDKSEFSDADGIVRLIAVREDKIWKMQLRNNSSEDVCLVNMSLRKWHERLAHQNVKYVKDALKRNDIKYHDDWDEYVCEGCVYGKQHRISHPSNTKVSEAVLDLIHVDLCEMDVRSLGGAKYFLLFKDDYSHYRSVYFLKSKDEAPAKLDAYLKLVENIFEKKVKLLRSDHGKEIENGSTREILEELGIFHTKSCTYTPQQNGRIERENRTVVEAARTVMHARGLDSSLWAEAVNYAVFTINQTGTSSVKGKSPADLWFGRKLSISKLKPFGCCCYVFIEKHRRGKTDKKSRKGLFIGYDIDTPGFRVYFPEDHDVVSSCNVVFDENGSVESFSQIEVMPEVIEGNAAEKKEESETESENFRGESRSDVDELSDGDEFHRLDAAGESEESDDEQEESANLPTRSLRDRRNLRRPTRLDDYFTGEEIDDVTDKALLMHGLESDVFGEVNLSVAEALLDKNWNKAMKDEFSSLSEMKTWKLVNKPKNVKPLSCRWVFARKSDGRHKARLVVRGYEQKQGQDYREVFSPVARHASMRLLLSIAASEEMEIFVFDVKSAFLNGDLKETIFMNQPEGFNDGTGRICLLKKSLYGLKQAPKIWNDEFKSFMKTMNFEDADDDPCVFYNRDRSVILTLHVDDGLMIGADVGAMNEILDKIDNKFGVKRQLVTNEPVTYLGMQVKWTSSGIFVSQSEFVTRLLQRFKCVDVNPASTPIEIGMVTDRENMVGDKPLSKLVPYREAVGSLLYLATMSRPDLSFSVNYLSRFNSCPMVSHWKMVKRVFQYLKGTSDDGIYFNGGKRLVAFSDSDFGGDLYTRKSTSGVLLVRGGPITWFTQKQKLVATSTAEAEYRAAVSTFNEVSWIRRLATELKRLDPEEPTTLYMDNQSAIHMLDSAGDGKISKGKKHVEIPRKFIQQHIGKIIRLQHVKSQDQLADLFTKPLARRVFETLKLKIIKGECCD